MTDEQPARPLFQALKEQHRKLRKTVGGLEQELRFVRDRYLALTDYSGKISYEFTALDEQVASIEASTLAQEFLRIEDQVSDLANLLVVIQQLHSSLDLSVIMASIHDIVLNIIGAEQMAIFELDPSSPTLLVTSTQGMDGCDLSGLTVGKGIIGKTIETGDRFIRGESEAQDELPIEQTLTACIPMKLEDKVVGAIATFRLLSHKSGLAPLDFDVFDLLGTHAAMALYCARLGKR